MEVLTEEEEIEELLLFIDHDEGLSYGTMTVEPVTVEQRLRFNLLVDNLGLRAKLPRHFFTLGSYVEAQAKIRAIEEKYLPSPRQIRLAYVLCRKAGIQNSLPSIKKMTRLQVERVIAEADNLLDQCRIGVPAFSVGRNKNVQDVLQQHESFRARYQPSQPYTVSDHQWNTWWSEKPDSIVGWDEWVSRKPVGNLL